MYALMLNLVWYIRLTRKLSGYAKNHSATICKDSIGNRGVDLELVALSPITKYSQHFWKFNTHLFCGLAHLPCMIFHWSCTDGAISIFVLLWASWGWSWRTCRHSNRIIIFRHHVVLVKRTHFRRLVGLQQKKLYLVNSMWQYSMTTPELMDNSFTN